MKIEISDLPKLRFRATRAAEKTCADLTTRLGWRHRNVAARLAIARSLSLHTPPPLLTEQEGDDDMATPIRGMQLFGEGSDLAAWLALITQSHGDRQMPKRALQALVTAHWTRGAELLRKDWESSGREMGRFVVRLAELANFPNDVGNEDRSAPEVSAPVIVGEARLSIGEVARDIKTDENVEFVLNGPGGSPHMAIMGGVGSGKTRTAIHMLRQLRRIGNVPLLAFDFKGDLAEGLGSAYGAEVLHPPEDSIPLDVLHVNSSDEIAIKTAAARIRDSIASVKSRRTSGVQSEALREAITATLHAGAAGGTISLPDVARALVNEYEERGRGADELTSTLNELTQFDLFLPGRSPAEFFARSWIILLPQDSSEEMRRLIINLTLNALDRWLNALPDAPTDDDGVRALRHTTLLDEAHVTLRTKLPALGNLVRMSRSKGGVVMLASQSPDDFEGAEEGYLDNMGMTLAFNTQAKPGPTKRIFGNGYSLTGLSVGEALCRIRSEARTRKIIAWES